MKGEIIMNQINKAIILPILAMVSLALKSIWHVELSDKDMDTIANGILSLVALAGIFMHPKKKES